MESLNESFSIVDTKFDYCQNPADVSSSDAREYFLCPHCSFDLCIEHAEEYQNQIQIEILILQNRAKSLEKQLNEYQPIETISEEVFSLLNEWKKKMYQFIDQYSEQVQMHIKQAENRLNDQWKITKEEYEQMLNQFVLLPIDQFLENLSSKSFLSHPNDLHEIDTRLIDVQGQMMNLFACRDLLRINFDLCSLGGDINISRGHFPSPTMNSSVSSRSESFHFLENIPRLDRIRLLYRFDALSTDTSALGVSPYRMNNSTQIFVTWIKPSTLTVFDAEQGMIKRIDVQPSFVSINDIIWCDYLNCFLIAGGALHTFDVINTEIKEIFISEHPQIWSITTHRTSLYVCYVMGESPLIEHRSLPSFRIIQSYTRSEVLPTSSSSIVEIGRCIRTNDFHIAMTVRNLITYQWRVDIFNFQFQRLYRGANFGLAAYSDYWCCLLTSIRSSCWLIMNNTSEEETLTLIDRQGRVRQQIRHEGYNVCVLQDEQRLLIKDQRGLAVFRI